MTLRLSAELLAAGYDYLRTTDPFIGWKLPKSGRIKFAVIKDPRRFADFGVENGVPTIRVSTARNGHTNTLLSTVAHEMIHAHQYLKGLETKGEHNADFKRRAARVCSAHGFDLKTF